MPPVQLNIRLSESDRGVLDAIAFLDDSTATDIARDAVMTVIREAAETRRVQEALRLRAEAKAEREGKLRPIEGAEHMFDSTSAV